MDGPTQEGNLFGPNSAAVNKKRNITKPLPGYNICWDPAISSPTITPRQKEQMLYRQRTPPPPTGEELAKEMFTKWKDNHRKK
jgi:hypothetical protein